MIKQFLLICILLKLSSVVFAQKATIDSLQNVLKNQKNDSNKVLIINKLAIHLLRTEPEKAAPYVKQGLSLSRQLHFLKGESMMLYLLGDYHRLRGNYVKSIEYITKSLKVAENINDELEIADNYRVLSLIYMDVRQYKPAIEFSRKALKLYQQKNNAVGIANSFSRIGRIYVVSNQKLDTALQYVDKAIAIAQKIKNEHLLAWVWNAKGEIYEKKQQLDSALHYFQQSLQLFKKVKDPLALAYNHLKIGNIYQKQKEFTNSLHNYQQALEDSQLFKAKEYLKLIYNGMAEVYAAQKNYPKATHYQELSVQLNDSLLSQSISEEMAFIRMQYEKEKQVHKVSLLEKEKELVRQELQTYSFVFLGIILFVMTILALIIQNNQQKKTANRLLQEKNEEIAQQTEELQVSNEEIIAQRDTLEEKVKDRTQNLKITSEKLRNYIFSNSHKVRRPIANILGLLYLFNYENPHDEFNVIILEKLQLSAQELSQITNEISQNMENLAEEKYSK